MQCIIKKPTRLEKDEKKYVVKCPKCSFFFIKEKNEENITIIKCPRCSKECTIK